VVSSASAPLNAIFFLQKSSQNSIVPVKHRLEIARRLLGCLIKPFVTGDWWQKMLALVETIALEVPCYHLKFDKSGKVVPELEKLVQ
jgi:hypothetical protein